jgi:hypothetical protein
MCGSGITTHYAVQKYWQDYQFVQKTYDFTKRRRLGELGQGTTGISGREIQ